MAVARCLRRGGLQRAIRSLLCPPEQLGLQNPDDHADAAVDEVMRIISLAVGQWRDRDGRDWYWSMVEREAPEPVQKPTALTHRPNPGPANCAKSWRHF